MNQKRSSQINTFLSETNWSNSQLTPVTGDASFRRYFRVTKDGQSAILMDAPKETNPSIRAFVDVATYLTKQGLSAPKIYGNSEPLGLALLEDLGDSLVARVLENNPDFEVEIYDAACDVLVHLHKRPAPSNFPVYDASMMGDLSALSAVWYAPSAKSQERIERCVSSLAGSICLSTDRFTQRDYHAENLIWLPGREGLQNVGLLDFQDAMAAPGPYDLVSLLSDARRDVSPETIARTKERYRNALGLDPTEFEAAYNFCGAQRSLRIVGVFARLWLRDGKPSYLPLIPRVWDQLQNHLAHPTLRELRDICAECLPLPSSETLAEIKARKRQDAK